MTPESNLVLSAASRPEPTSTYSLCSSYSDRVRNAVDVRPHLTFFDYSLLYSMIHTKSIVNVLLGETTILKFRQRFSVSIYIGRVIREEIHHLSSRSANSMKECIHE